MNKDISKKIIDVTGTELTPGEPSVCLGNGEQGFQCCCDACDHYLLCFPQFDPKNEKIDILCYRLLYEAYKKVPAIQQGLFWLVFLTEYPRLPFFPC